MLRRCLAAWMVSATWLACWLTWTAVAAAASPGSEPPFFQKKATWRRRSWRRAEALVRAEADDEKREAAQKAADPVLNSFQPLQDEVLGKQAPRPLRIRVAGLKMLFIGARGPNDVIFGDARLTDRQGRSAPLAALRGRRPAASCDSTCPRASR